MKKLFLVLLILVYVLPLQCFAEEMFSTKYFTFYGEQTQEQVVEKLGMEPDKLYTKVMDMLNLHIYNLNVEIIMFNNQEELSQKAQLLTGEEFRERSFYLHSAGTIYISYPDMTAGILAHEMTHALLCSYFVNRPSIEMQEILCGYVEYKIKNMILPEPFNF